MGNNPYNVDNTQNVNKAARKNLICSVDFNLSAAGTVVCDLGAFMNNRAIQVNSGAGSISAINISLDGENFSASGVSAAAGIQSIAKPCRYVQIVTTGAAAGLVFGSLY